ncbi:MAG: hypothetical protein MUP22_10465, partial [Desulfobacterales bacterium]|nr:hypothetical protein [Desulfobacterales bacterium]
VYAFSIFELYSSNAAPQHQNIFIRYTIGAVWNRRNSIELQKYILNNNPKEIIGIIKIIKNGDLKI